MKITRWKLLGILVVVALAVVGVAATSVFAAPPTPPANPNGAYGYGYGYGMMGGYNIDRMAKLLGMTDADLVNQLQQGKTLVQIAQDKGVTEQQLIDTLTAPYKDELQLRVKYQYLTQQQADSLLQQMTDRVKTAINTAWNANNGGYGYGPGYGCGGAGFGGMMGGFGGMMGGFGRFGGPTGGTVNPSNGSFGGFGRGMMGGFGRTL